MDLLFTQEEEELPWAAGCTTERKQKVHHQRLYCHTLLFQSLSNTCRYRQSKMLKSELMLELNTKVKNIYVLPLLLLLWIKTSKMYNWNQIWRQYKKQPTSNLNWPLPVAEREHLRGAWSGASSRVNERITVSQTNWVPLMSSSPSSWAGMPPPSVPDPALWGTSEIRWQGDKCYATQTTDLIDQEVCSHFYT